MDLRKMMLPAGWYPQAEDEASKTLLKWEPLEYGNKRAVSAVVPHAGWTYSGEISWKVIHQIPEETELIIVAGGHLPPDSTPLLMNYDALETPFGNLTVDNEAAKMLCSGFAPDRAADNTVEIQLPMIKRRRPDVPVLPVRLPPDQSSIDWAHRASEILADRKVFFLGSTDLSHYGMRFMYTDYGYGQRARDTIRSLDAEFLNALQDNNLSKALDMAVNNHCACSAGAAVAAAMFGSCKGAEGTIIDHGYSYETFDHGGDFVGYGSLAYFI